MKRGAVALLLCLLPVLCQAQVADSAWKALLNRNVLIEKADGSEVRGELTLIEQDTVSVIKDDGQVVIVQKSQVARVRARPAGSNAAEAGRSADPGWSRNAAITGYVTAPVVLGFAVAAELTKGSFVPSIPLGAAALVLDGVMVPVVAAGGASARNGTAGGIPALRITGWVAYGLSMLEGAGLVILGLQGFNPPTAVITSTGLLGTCALVAMAVDASVSGSQAAKRGGGITSGGSDGLVVQAAAVPILTPAAGHGSGNPRAGLQLLIRATY